MKLIVFIFLFVSIPTLLLARHGKGGVLTYEYLGNGSAANTSKYRITAIHYIDCEGTQFIEAAIYIGIFDGSSNSLVRTLTIAKNSQTNIQKTSFGCITPAPVVCYVVCDYITEIELPNNNSGYIISEQECCRITGIVNIFNSSNYGITNSTSIPGVINNVIYRNNSSPVFSRRDTAVICHDSYFTLDFSATDVDGDSLAYIFCSAKTGGTMQNRQPNPPSSPPYTDITYTGAYSGGQPLGAGVTVNSKTGILSGIAPSITGHYVVSICVSEYRKGIFLSTNKKEVQIEVANCNLTGTALKASYINCNDFSFTFQNEVPSTNVTSYYWDFGVPNITTDVSTTATPTFTYSDTGQYTLRLKVANATGCEDSATANVFVYPGFKPGFTVTGSCYQNPFIFKDTTRAVYGFVNGWNWSFGDNSSPSALQAPSHFYSSMGNYMAALIVTSSKGCTDTVIKNITVFNKPFLSLPFHDTLICSIDSLTLHANGTGVFSWTPTTSLIYANTSSPVVFPVDTSTYLVTLNENGCIAEDSIRVNVLDYVTVSLPPELTICRSDSIQLLPDSYALQYVWSPTTGLNDPKIKQPMASPSGNTIYHVTANLGKCQDETSVEIKVVPYPTVAAAGDTTICYASFAQLSATITGSSFTWTPATSLQNTFSLFPIANPLQTTSYILTVYDTFGCPKPSRDTVTINVRPRINAFAGNDTLIVANQPLQLNASGGVQYSWYPAVGLNNSLVADPVSLLSSTIDSMVYTVRVFSSEGCYADDDIKIKVFKTEPDIFVPSAFSPDENGKNDIIRPILVGIKKLESFKIFNRWGQLLFSTNLPNQGWDGKIKGISQATNTFVYVATGTSYLGKRIVKKGTVTLVR